VNFDELITPEEREEIERAIESINRMLQRAALLASHITDFIDGRFDGKA
jgi:hypothetical protein